MSSGWSSPGPKVESNLESFLHSVTPLVPTKPLSLQEVGVETIEYFILEDLWQCYDEWSAYGAGIPVALNGRETVVQYYAPYLSAIQLYTINRDKREGAKLSSDHVSETDEFSGSFTNNSSKTWDTTSTDSSFDHDCLWPAREWDPLAYPYFQYCETVSPYWRVPFVDKIAEFADNFPGLFSLKSTDLSPASWMSVAWLGALAYPIYHIPFKGKVEDLSTYFLTFHTLSSCFQDTHGSNDISFPYVVETVAEAKSENKIKLPPFGLSTLRMQGEIWINDVAGDYEKLINLHCAADSWLKQLGFHHHDFDYYQKKNQEVAC
ncbi:hypothetical protein Pfo_010925 [Paulownia fortunei]|nr:hypothetical protein Pfo_010925 [Paulownia fortunei]